ncbi:T9SS type A sorting domain-containing protein [Psychroserpens ponticola]|uniref:T9SS type A sorting domain-containing protein n=1 Tax=Psychroserpens ponticola TaxID=2932268 RepID=A0ABY7RX21_9FLAO|nr:T9SS type A sorting domain-containing protein [Psychroserpens ponticola]WCO00255.1 T9SS type A sorting domain-containing protein [Psychroserpens ponticola]
MKQILTFIILLSLIHFTYGQDIASTNSGANSNNNLIYSIGEVFVIPENQDELSSGIIGVISKIEFTSLGINEIEVSENLQFYPNPTSNFLFLELENKTINEIYIYDLNGRFIGNKKIINQKVSLEELQTGTYIIKTDNQNIQSFKIIKK